MAEPRSRFPAYPPDIDHDLQLFLEAVRAELTRIGKIVEPPGTIRVETIVIDEATMDSLVVGAAPTSWPSPPASGIANVAASLHVGTTYTAPGVGGLRTEGAIVSESTVTSTGLLTAQAGLTVSGGTLLAQGNIARIEGANPYVAWRETDQALPAGLWRLFLDGDRLDVRRNSAVAGDFSTEDSPIQFAAGNAVHVGRTYATPPADGLRVQGGITVDDRVTITMPSDQVYGLTLQQAAGTNTPRLLFYNTTSGAGTAAVILQTQSNRLGFRTGGTPGVTSGTERWYYNATELAPATAGGLTLGTAALPWKDPHFGFDASNRLDITISATGAVTYDAVGTGALHTFSDDIAIGSLGRFDSTDTPTEGQMLIYHAGSINKWQAETLLMLYVAGDTRSQLLADNTAAQYLIADPGTGADSPVGAPPIPATPVVDQENLAHTLEIRGYSKPADFRYFEWEYCTGASCVSWGALATTTSVKLVHSRLVEGTIYRYRVRAVDRAGNASSFSTPTGDNAAARNSKTHAFGAIIASEIAVASLAAISADIGIITAGQLRNNPNTAGINLYGAGGIPGGWTSGINFESGATVSGMSRYLNFAATGSGAFIFSEKFEARVDGVAIFRGVAQDADTSVKFKIDFPNRLLTITDEQATPRVRVEIGEIGAGTADWGIRLSDANGTAILQTFGATPTNAVQVSGLQSGTISGLSADRVDLGTHVLNIVHTSITALHLEAMSTAVMQVYGPNLRPLLEMSDGIPAVGANSSLFTFSGTLTEAGSGTHARLVGTAFDAPTVTAGGAAVTNTATVYIGNAMSATVSGRNYALWVDSGVTRLDGHVIPGADGSATLGTATAGERWQALYLFDTDVGLSILRNAANVVSIETPSGDAIIIKDGNSNQIVLDSNGLSLSSLIVGGAKLTSLLSNTATWDPGVIGAHGQVSTTITVTGAAAGDIVHANQPWASAGIHVWARVSSADTVTVYAFNDTGSGLDPASDTVRVVVLKF